jgi:hypothetical protein
MQSLWRAVGLSAGVCVVLLSALTALRVWNLEPATSVQSAIVRVSALLVVLFLAYSAYHGGSFVESWILALGPSLAFAVNLFVPVAAPESLGWVGYPLVGAVFVATVLGGIGFLLGDVARRVRDEQRSVESS